MRPASDKLAGTLRVERDFVFRAVHFERSQIQLILILANLRIQLVVALAKAILFALLLLDRLCVLRFRGGELFQLCGDSLRFGFQFAGLAGKHLANDGAHLLANFRVTTRFGRLPLQRAQLLLDFHDNVINAREIKLGRLQLGFGQPFFCFEFRYARGFFDDCAALHRLGGKNLTDAALLDDCVRVRA